MKTRKFALVGALAFAAAAFVGGCAEDKALTTNEGACSGEKACTSEKAAACTASGEKASGCCAANKDAAAKAAPAKNN